MVDRDCVLAVYRGCALGLANLIRGSCGYLACKSQGLLHVCISSVDLVSLCFNLTSLQCTRFLSAMHTFPLCNACLASLQSTSYLPAAGFGLLTPNRPIRIVDLLQISVNFKVASCVVHSRSSSILLFCCLYDCYYRLLSSIAARASVASESIAPQQPRDSSVSMAWVQTAR